MRNMKLNKIIEYLKSMGFYHDTFDIAELGIEKILAEYNICDNFSQEELAVLEPDIVELAEQNEFREAFRLANLDIAEMV